MPCTIVVGGFFGDEGKGKIVSYLALKDKPSIVVRGGVGPNAGHTVRYNEKTYSLRLVPCGFVYDRCRLLVGSGVALNIKVFLSEVELTGCRGRIGVDRQCAIIEEKHIKQEMESSYLSQKIGTTKSGVGVCNAERALRVARLAKDFPELSEYLCDVSSEVNDSLKRGDNVLAEGTQGTFLSIYHGTYPYCTSKDVCASAVCSDIGIGPTAVSEVIIVFKAYVTRVGQGPLENELLRDEVVRRGWLEYGTVTGRERRAASFNFNLARKAVQLNGATQIALTKMDVVFSEAGEARSFDELPSEAKKFVGEIEEKTNVPVTIIGTGPSAEDIINLRYKRV